MRSHTENENAFIETLRTTPLDQAHRRLVEFDGDTLTAACCLGVGALMMPNTGAHPHAGRTATVQFAGREWVSLPPLQFADWLGYPGQIGETEGWNPMVDWPSDLLTQEVRRRFTAEPALASYAEMNDSGEFTFAQIADVWAYFGVKE